MNTQSVSLRLKLATQIQVLLYLLYHQTGTSGYFQLHNLFLTL